MTLPFSILKRLALFPANDAPCNESKMAAAAANFIFPALSEWKLGNTSKYDGALNLQRPHEFIRHFVDAKHNRVAAVQIREKSVAGATNLLRLLWRRRDTDQNRDRKHDKP